MINLAGHTLYKVGHWLTIPGFNERRIHTVLSYTIPRPRYQACATNTYCIYASRTSGVPLLFNRILHDFLRVFTFKSFSS
jgi:hypothetical protein